MHCKFSSSFPPPFDTGTMWSTCCASVSLPSLLQGWHKPKSRRRMRCRIFAHAWPDRSLRRCGFVMVGKDIKKDLPIRQRAGFSAVRRAQKQQRPLRSPQ